MPQKRSIVSCPFENRHLDSLERIIEKDDVSFASSKRTHNVHSPEKPVINFCHSTGNVNGFFSPHKLRASHGLWAALIRAQKKTKEKRTHNRRGYLLCGVTILFSAFLCKRLRFGRNGPMAGVCVCTIQITGLRQIHSILHQHFSLPPPPSLLLLLLFG